MRRVFVSALTVVIACRKGVITASARPQETPIANVDGALEGQGTNTLFLRTVGKETISESRKQPKPERTAERSRGIITSVFHQPKTMLATQSRNPNLSRFGGGANAVYGDSEVLGESTMLSSTNRANSQHKRLPSLMSLVGVGDQSLRRGKGGSSETSGQNKRKSGSSSSQGVPYPGSQACNGKVSKRKVKVSNGKHGFGESCRGKGSGNKGSSKSNTGGIPSPAPCNSYSGKGKGKGLSKMSDGIGCADTLASAPSTSLPTEKPSSTPTALPSIPPSMNPSRTPSSSPTVSPTGTPSFNPSSSPTATPTSTPTEPPTPSPSEQPSTSQMPTVPRIAVAVAPFRLDFEGVANATAADFAELETFVLELLDDLYTDLFDGQPATDYSGLQGGASSFADSHVDFDMDFVFTGSSSSIPDVDTLGTLLEDVLLSTLFLDSLADLSPANPFSTATGVQIN